MESRRQLGNAGIFNRKTGHGFAAFFDAGAGFTFTLNVYPEPFTPAGVKAKGFK
jgi:hypothetical protein